MMKSAKSLQECGSIGPRAGTDSGKGYAEPKALQMGFRECLTRQATCNKAWLLPGLVELDSPL
jgi:hypothetical protein